MSLSPPEYLRHILDEIDYVLTHIPETFDSFANDETLKRAFIRSIEIVGEASKKLPDEIKSAQPNIEWRKVAGMRDRLIHDYFGVDYTIVWDVVSQKFPALRGNIQALLDSLEKRQ